MSLLERLQHALADRYRIERELGRGGMATVYLAADLRHSRPVALKVLRPEIGPALGADRFDREIAIAGRLQHPHILGLFDSGVADGMLWYTMPYVEGESLRARLAREVQLDASDAVRIACEVAEALACAHAAGVIHRDIKPDNILITGGHAVVADFGIAHALDVAGGDRLTETGLALGTPQYMSPEQAAGGRHVDARTDVYALGCVLYEMLAGEPPFGGPTPQAVLARHSMDPVPSLRTIRDTVSAALEATVRKALAKVPADRYHSALEFKDALTRVDSAPPEAPTPLRLRLPRWPALTVPLLGAAVVALGAGLMRGRSAGGESDTIQAIAVAPLANLTGDSSQVYLAEGFTSQLVARLAQIGALRVVGLKGEQAGRSTDDLARALGIDAVLSGDLQRSGDAVRITLRLVSVAGGRALWARTYDGELRRILNLQDEAARSVAERISISLTSAERSRLSAAKPEVDPAAYQAYVRGWHFLERVSGPDFRRALGYFHEAIKIDPAYAPAYVGLALTYEELGYYGMEPAREAYPRSRSAALKALEFDSTNGEAHVLLASVDAAYSWNFEAAEQGFRRGLELSPKFARGHMEYAMLLTSLGRIDEALEQMKQAQELDPLSQLNQAATARPYYNGRRYEEAIAQAKRALELDSTFSRAHYWLGMTYAQLGRPRDAISEFELTLRQTGPLPVYQAAAAYAYARAGDELRARAMLATLETEARSEPVSGVEIAAVHAALGEVERCFEWLAQAFERRDPLVRFLAVDPRFDPVRPDPRFGALLGRIGFPPMRAPAAGPSTPPPASP